MSDGGHTVPFNLLMGTSPSYKECCCQSNQEGCPEGKVTDATPGFIFPPLSLHCAYIQHPLILSIINEVVSWSEWLYPPRIYVLKSWPSKAIVLVGGAFGSCLSHDGRTLMNKISVLLKKPQSERSVGPSARWGYNGDFGAQKRDWPDRARSLTSSLQNCEK